MRRSRCSPTPRQGLVEQCPQGTMLAGRANPYQHFLARCGATAADILGQDISANVY
jgi:hypothetical protein